MVGEGPHLGSVPWAPGVQTALRGSREGVPVALILENCRGHPQPFTQDGESLPIVSGFLLAPSPEAPCFPPFPRSRQDRMVLHSVCPVSPHFPHRAKSLGRQLPGRYGQEEQVDKGDWKKREPCPFAEPGSPRLPSPAGHLSHPDNGTSREEHALCVPAHQPEGEQGIPGGDAGQPGGKRARRREECRPKNQKGAPAAARVFKMSDVSLPQAPSNSAKAAAGQRQVLP